jgi:hypothetical protein
MELDRILKVGLKGPWQGWEMRANTDGKRLGKSAWRSYHMGISSLQPYQSSQLILSLFFISQSFFFVFPTFPAHGRSLAIFFFLLAATDRLRPTLPENRPSASSRV